MLKVKKIQLEKIIKLIQLKKLVKASFEIF